MFPFTEKMLFTIKSSNEMVTDVNTPAKKPFEHKKN